MPRRKPAAAPESQEVESYAYGSATRRNAPNADNAAMLHTPGQPTPAALAEKTAPYLANNPANYSRPFLQWQQPDETHREPRAYGPLYVHEKINPAVIFQGLMQQAEHGKTRQIGLFATAREAFNGFKTPSGEKAVNAANEPYQYANGHWTNRLLRATAQRAMRSLLHYDGLAGQVNLIYMDPPYNKKFSSNFAPAANQFEAKENVDGIPNDPLAVQAFRDTYEHGIHSYLDGLQEQLELARQLLTDDGSIIVQIGPDNLHYVAVLMSQVFDHENHVATIPYVTSTNQSTSMIPEIGNWLLWYAKNKEQAQLKYHQLYQPITIEADLATWGIQFGASWELPNGESKPITQKQKENPSLLPQGSRLFRLGMLTSTKVSMTGRSDVYYHHPDDQPCTNAGWSQEDRAQARANTNHEDHICDPTSCQTPLPDNWNDHICSTDCRFEGTRKCPKGRKCGKNCHANAVPCHTGRQWRVSLSGLHAIATAGRMTMGTQNPSWKDYFDDNPGKYISSHWGNLAAQRNKQYIVETPPTVLERCLLMTTDPGDLVLDLTCGSGAMPVQCETWGRRWLAVDVSAVSIAIARDRILTGAYPYHLLQDSPEGHAVEHKLNQEIVKTDEPFIPKAAYHRDPAQGFVVARQIRVSAATLAYGAKIPADVIYHPDRTFKDDRKLRPASNFEVCSDSPYRAVSPEQILAPETDYALPLDRPEALAAALTRQELFLEPTQIRMADNLAASGISQNGKARYAVKNLQPLDHPDLTHTALITDPEGKEHKAGFYLGKADEIISYTKIANAGMVAKSNGYSHLGIVGFSHDGDVHRAAQNVLGLTVLNISANRDLQLSNLKDQKRDNGFVIISEPEVQLLRHPDGMISLKVIGINAFDPRKGVVDEPSANQIKAIIVDSAYDGQRFIASHYNILKTDKNSRAYRNLQAAFKGAIAAETWQRMQTTETAPFLLPEQDAKIAVKVIDQTGTEHMTIIHDPLDNKWY